MPPVSNGRTQSWLLALALLLPGCGGPSDETLLDELRVLAMVPDAPEIGPMETAVFQTRVVDPQNRGGDLLVWGCTLLSETCLEDEEGRAPEVLTLGEGSAETEIAASAALAAVAGEEPLPLILVWALACEPGLCPLLDEVRAGEEIDPAVWAEPTDWIDTLPLDGVSLALSTLYVSARAPEDRHPAPVMSVNSEIWSVAPGETLSLQVEADGELGEEAKVWAYAEGGGFTTPSERLDAGGGATLSWVAPDEPGEVALYVVLVDGLGGSALWEGVASVE